MFNIEYQRDGNKVKIYIYFPANLSKVRDLIEVVRPAGCGLELVPAEIIQTIDGIQVHSYEYHTKFPYDSTRYEVSNKDKVGFAEVENINHITAINGGTHNQYHNQVW